MLSKAAILSSRARVKACVSERYRRIGWMQTRYSCTLVEMAVESLEMSENLTAFPDNVDRENSHVASCFGTWKIYCILFNKKMTNFLVMSESRWCWFLRCINNFVYFLTYVFGFSRSWRLANVEETLKTSCRLVGELVSALWVRSC